MSRLTRIELHCFRHRLAMPMQTVFGRVDSRPALLVRVEDEDGAEGWGEIWCNFPQPGAEYRARLAAVVLPRALRGLTVADHTTAFQTLRSRLHRLVLQADEPGPADQIASGVDIALHDLAARRQGVPLATLLGGTPRPLPVYASGIDSRQAGVMIAAARSAGYTAFKIRIGFGHDSDVRTTSSAANGLEAGEQLFADANQNWDREDAVAMAQALSDTGLGWLEEPLPVDSPLADWRAVAAASSMPIAGGENMRSEAEFSDAAAGDVFGIIQPDICKWGGLSMCAAIARRIIASGKRYCPHYLGGGIGLMASAHLLSAVGRGRPARDRCQRQCATRAPCRPAVAAKRWHGAGTARGPGLGFVPDMAGIAPMSVLHFDERIEAA